MIESGGIHHWISLEKTAKVEAFKNDAGVSVIARKKLEDLLRQVTGHTFKYSLATSPVLLPAFFARCDGICRRSILKRAYPGHAGTMWQLDGPET